MLWHLAQAFDISLNQFRRSVVVIENGEDLPDYRVIRLPQSYIKAEKCVDDAEYDAVYEVSYRRSYSLLMVEAAIGRLVRRLFCGIAWEVWLQHSLPVLC